MILRTGICFTFLILSISGQKFHESMTDDEIRMVFNTAPEMMHEVEYEVVELVHQDVPSDHNRVRRATPKLHMRAFDQNYTLYIEENNHVLVGKNTPIFMAKRSFARSSGEPITYTRTPFPVPNLKLYHDVKNRAAVTMYRDSNNKVHVNGIVGHKIAVRSLPSRFHDFMQSSMNFAGSFFTPDDFDNEPIFSSSFSRPTHHVVIKTKGNNFDDIDNQIADLRNKFNLGSSLNFGGNPNSKYVFKKVVTKNGVVVENTEKTSDDSDESPEGFSANQIEDFKNKWSFGNSPGVNKVNYKKTINGVPVDAYTKTFARPTTSPRPSDNDIDNSIDDFGFGSSHGANKVIYKKTVNGVPVDAYTKTYTRPITTPKSSDNDIPSSIDDLRKKWNQHKKVLPPRTDYPSKHVVVEEPASHHHHSHKVENSKPSSKPDQDTVYPELLIVVDYGTYKTHNKDLEILSSYMVAFWNAVDLRYREISKPSIRLNIAGIIVPQAIDCAPYMESHVVSADTILVDQTLTKMGEYFSKSFKDFNNYDIVVGISHRNLGSINNGKLNKDISGLAAFRGACKTKIGHAVAIIKDTGGFMGITTAAHEVAHTLGAPHDDESSKTIPGGPCNWDDGYLMSYKRRDERGQHWSKCSVRAIQDFVKEEQAECLRNKPDVGSSYSKILPGRLLSRDEQCQKSMGLVSYKDKESDCAVLYCAKYMDRMVQTQTAYRPPAEGSYCGEGQICLNAKCVKDPEL